MAIETVLGSIGLKIAERIIEKIAGGKALEQITAVEVTTADELNALTRQARKSRRKKT